MSLAHVTRTHFCHHLKQYIIAVLHAICIDQGHFCIYIFMLVK